MFGGIDYLPEFRVVVVKADLHLYCHFNLVVSTKLAKLNYFLHQPFFKQESWGAC